MKLSRLLPLSLALAAALVAPAKAEDLLTLWDLARAYDGTWQSAKAQYDANLFRAEQSRAGILPSASLSSNVTRFNSELVSPSVQRTFTGQTLGVNATQPLYRPGNVAAWEQAKRSVEIAEAQLTAAGQDLMVRLVQSYFDVLAAQDTLEVVRALKTATGEQLASAKRNFEVGTTTITDTREAQSRYDLTIAQEIAAANDVRVKRLALDSLVGRNGVAPVPLTLPMKVNPPIPEDVNAWVQQGDEMSPSIQQAKSAVEVAQLETEKAKAGHKPTLDLVAGYNIARNPEGSLQQGPAPTRFNTASVGLLFNMPLYAGGAIENRIRETLSLEEKAQADMETTRRTVAQAVRTAYYGVVSGLGQVNALEAAEASSQSALDANKLGYQVGVRINIDVLNSQSQLYQTKRDLALARYNVLIGHLKLRQSNGTLMPVDLEKLNQLLTK
jgi:outer membrane protein